MKSAFLTNDQIVRLTSVSLGLQRDNIFQIKETIL